MSLRGNYALSPADEMLLRKRLGKGCLVAGCLLPVLIGGGILARGYVPKGGTYVLDIAIVALLLFVLQRYTVAASHARFELGREYFQKGEFASAVAALLPFSKYGNRNYDRTGEAHYLLALAARSCGEIEFAKQIATFVVKHRKTEWRDLAAEILEESP